MSEILALKRKDFIKFPKTDEEITAENQGFYAIGHFPGVVGAVDCTHVKIQSPDGDTAELFCNRKVFFPSMFKLFVIQNWKLQTLWRDGVDQSMMHEFLKILQ